jgi:hypothetical protein
MIETLTLSEEFIAGPARLRVDVHGSKPMDHVLEDMNFLNYRLAEVRIAPEVTLPLADLAWRHDGDQSVDYDGRHMTFTGPWASGPIQKAIVTLLALRMEEHGLHPFHSSAVRYRDHTILFMGGESNHGKSMGQIEACRRGSKAPFLKKRDAGTERADKAAPEAGVDKFFGGMPTWEILADPTPVDVVVLPAIDGNFAPSTAAMIPFERQFQTFHSLQNYFLLDELLAPGHTMPIVDTESLRAARAAFVQRFAERPYYFVRAATPQVLLDEVERVL